MTDHDDSPSDPATLHRALEDVGRNMGTATYIPAALDRLIEKAREATSALRDAVREGRRIDFRQRDELVMAIHHALDALRAALDAQPPQAPQWQPIETCPKDASWFLGRLEDGEVARVHWASDLSGSEQPAFQGCFRLSGSYFSEVNPTHWMPLPDPPVAEGRRAQERPQ